MADAERASVTATDLEAELRRAMRAPDPELGRALKQLDREQSDFGRYTFLVGLADVDMTLFCRTIESDPRRLIPILIRGGRNSSRGGRAESWPVPNVSSRQEMAVGGIGD